MTFFSHPIDKRIKSHYYIIKDLREGSLIEWNILKTRICLQLLEQFYVVYHVFLSWWSSISSIDSINSSRSSSSDYYIAKYESTGLYALKIFSSYNTFVLQAFYDAVMWFYPLMDSMAPKHLKYIGNIMQVKIIFTPKSC